MPVISYLLSKLTFAYIAEMVAIHGIKHVAVSTLKNIPTLPQRIKSFLSGHVEVPINNHLQSAIVKAQWLSAQVFIKEMHKVDKLKNSYLNVNHSVNEIIISIEKETYLFNDQLIDDFEIETLLSSNDSNNYLNDLKEKISELFLIELDKCTGDIKKMADYQLLKKYIKNGWTEKKLDWFELMVVFFNQLLSGDNNIARDTFQNQVLSKICIKFNDFETYILASHKIGFEIIKKIQGEFVEIKSGISQINSELIRNSKILEEIHGHISNPIDLDLFSKFEAFNKKIEKLKIEIKKIYTKIIKTKGFLKTELEEKILIRFKKDLDSIEDLYYEKNQELDTCENDKKEFVTTIQNLWIIVNSDKGNRLNLAKEALMNGDLNGAERILNQEDIEIEYSKIIKIEDTINEEKERIAKEFLARANIVLTLKKEINWLEESIENLEKASKISVDSTTLFDVANLFMNLNFSTNAIICFNQSVKLDASNFIKGQIFNNLGIIYKSLGDFKNGESSHLNSIKIKKLLSEENPEKYLIYLANSYINLGVFYFHFSKEEEAKINYLLAMKELEELRLKYNAVYLPFFGQLFNNMGRLFHQVGKLTDAKSAYLESIRVLRAIPKEEIDNITNVQISNALVNLGNLHLNEKSFLIAYSHFSEAYSILESVFKDEPIRYSSNIGVCLIGLGNACFLNLEFDKAEDSLNEALGIFSRINRSNKFDLQIATIYSNLGSLYKSTNRNGYTEFILKSNQILNKLSDKIFEVKNLKVHNEKLLLT